MPEEAMAAAATAGVPVASSASSSATATADIGAKERVKGEKGHCRYKYTKAKGLARNSSERNSAKVIKKQQIEPRFL